MGTQDSYRDNSEYLPQVQKQTMGCEKRQGGNLTMPETLKSAVHRRIIALNKRSVIWSEPLPDEDAIYNKVEQNLLNGFICCYCGRHLKITESSPSLSVFSLDHYIPFASGGYNHISILLYVATHAISLKGQ